MQIYHKSEIINLLYKNFKLKITSQSSIECYKDSLEIISLYFGNKKILIIDAIIDDKIEDGTFNFQTRISDDIMIFFDRNFRTLAKFLGSDVPEDYKKIENSKNINNELYQLITIFLNKNNKTLQNKTKNYNKLYDYELKKFFSNTFKIPFSADKEFFLFYDDEIKPRYHDKMSKKILNNVLIRIKDSSAYITTSSENNENKKQITLKPFGMYKVGKKYYSGLSKYIKEVATNKEDCDIIRVNANYSKRKYLKYKQLPVDKKILKSLPYITALPANNQQFLLKYEKKTKTYFLLNSKNEKITIAHPDLLIILAK